MTMPSETAWLFLLAMGIGAGVGLFYGFLRPLRPRFTTLCDLLLLPVVFYAWIYHSFALCRGDIRFGHALGILLGALVWDRTVGRLLHPLFVGFWKLVGIIFLFLSRPVKFFLKKSADFLKFLLAIGKKTITIRQKEKESGGSGHGNKT